MLTSLMDLKSYTILYELNSYGKSMIVFIAQYKREVTLIIYNMQSV
jgi:hypothetical protein